MPLIAEYAITPDVFDRTSYSSQDVCGLHLSTIRQVMMDEGLVWDLRAGEWQRLLFAGSRPWHRRAKEIVKKLATQGRLVELPPVLPAVPVNDPEWCAEALAAHEREGMTGGVIVTANVKDCYPEERIVERVDRLSTAQWWAVRSASIRLDRKLADYRQHLASILRCANSLQFIDPHLDPRQDRYRDFVKLLSAAKGRREPPAIEIHRACYVGSGPSRQFPDFERAFRDVLAEPLRVAGLVAEIFIWDDFHDRYLISNLIGISLPNGFDTTSKPGDVTTWTRLGRDTRDDIQREFDEASGRHKLRAKFTLP